MISTINEKGNLSIGVDPVVAISEQIVLFFMGFVERRRSSVGQTLSMPDRTTKGQILDVVRNDEARGFESGVDDEGVQNMWQITSDLSHGRGD